jgi:hypothetical protein
MTADEQADFDGADEAFKSVDRDIKNRRRVAEQESELNRAAPPRAPDEAEADNASTTTTTRAPAPSGRVSANDGPRGHWGWRNFGQFANAVRGREGRTGRSAPPERAPSTYGSERRRRTADTPSRPTSAPRS